MKTKKISIIIFLFIVITSFSGCALFPGGSSTKKSSKQLTNRNDHQGVFKSTDGGKTWEHKIKTDQEGEESILDKIKISSMKMDPRDNQTLYLGTIGEGLYKTENGGDLWFKMGDENGILDDKATVYSIEIEKGNSNVIYIATLNHNRGELLRSEDGGKSWISSYIGSEPGKQVNYVKIDPIHKNIIYVGTEQGGMIKSENRGKTWFSLVWFKEGIKDFVVDFRNNNGIILRTNNEILKSVNAGDDWESLNKKINKTLKMKISISQISSMTIDNKNPLVIYLTYNNLILVTRDGGLTWERMNTITPSLTIVGTAPKVKQIGITGDVIYYGAGNALYKSNDKGISWSSYDIPIKGDVRYTVNDYLNSNIIYLGAFYDQPKKKK